MLRNQKHTYNKVNHQSQTFSDGYCQCHKPCLPQIMRILFYLSHWEYAYLELIFLHYLNVWIRVMFCFMEKNNYSNTIYYFNLVFSFMDFFFFNFTCWVLRTSPSGTCFLESCYLTLTHCSNTKNQWFLKCSLEIFLVVCYSYLISSLYI